MPRDLGSAPCRFVAVRQALIWFAENIATFANAWNYPDQQEGWQPVSAAKLGSWYLLMLISFVLVELVQHARPPDRATQP